MSSRQYIPSIDDVSSGTPSVAPTEKKFDPPECELTRFPLYGTDEEKVQQGMDWMDVGGRLEYWNVTRKEWAIYSPYIHGELIHIVKDTPAVSRVWAKPTKQPGFLILTDPAVIEAHKAAGRKVEHTMADMTGWLECQCKDLVYSCSIGARHRLVLTIDLVLMEDGTVCWENPDG